MGCKESKGAAEPRSTHFYENKLLRDANLEPLTAAQLAAFDDWWNLIVKALANKTPLPLLATQESMAPVKMLFKRYDADMDSLLNKKEAVEFMKESWRVAGGDGDEPVEHLTARLKAIRCLDVKTGEKFSWEDFERASRIVGIWLEKGKAKEAMEKLLEQK